MIGLYGATGLTGALTAEALQGQDIPFFIAGRSEARLKSLAERLNPSPEIVVCDAGDAPGLMGMASRAKVLIACAGPFSRIGRVPVRACVAAGCHYLDSTGEQGFMKWVRDAWHEPATEKGVALISAAAFEYALSDIFLHRSCMGYDRVDALDVGYFVRGFDPSPGTAKSVLEVVRQVPLAFENGALKRSRCLVQRAFEVGDRQLKATQFPGGEVIHAPLHLQGIRRVRTFMNGLPAPWMVSLSRLTLSIPGLSFLAARWMDFKVKAPGEPARERAQVTLVQEVEGVRNGRRMRRIAHIRAQDPYALTATLLVEQARRMHDPEFAARGFVSPAQAFDPESLAQFCESHGVRFTLGTEIPVP